MNDSRAVRGCVQKRAIVSPPFGTPPILREPISKSQSNYTKNAGSDAANLAKAVHLIKVAGDGSAIEVGYLLGARLMTG